MIDEDLVYEEVDNPLSWSVTRLKTIEGCGRQYWFRYVDRAEGVPTPYLAFGKAVHRTIEEIHKADDFSEWWQELWSDLWYQYADGVGWSGFSKYEFNDRGPKMIRKYVAKNTDVNIVELETEFSDFKIGDTSVRGVIDQVRRTKEGRLLVVDLKTSKYPPDPLILRADPQFTIYHRYAKEKYGEDPLVALYHLESGRMYQTTRTDQDIDLVESMLRQGQIKVEEKLFERNVTSNCRYCSFLEPCLTPNEPNNI